MSYFGIPIRNGLPIGLGSVAPLASGGGSPFSPLSLFSGGAPGAWYDPSDYSTLFQDSAGTTPVTAVEQPVGRMLDKSGYGNHAFQATSASRPVLSARYNLLTKTEQFDAAAWTKASATITANAAVAPDGTTTADKFIPASGAGGATVAQLIPVVVAQHTFTFRAKADEQSSISLVSNLTGTFRANIFNLSAQTVSPGTGWAASIAPDPAGNGWFICSCSATADTAASKTFQISNNSAGWTGNGTSGVYIWGASLVPANQSTLTYQRVNTATDYNTTGFLPYLKFDGVDDSLSTNSISFTSTDKVSVFAGVRKLTNTFQMYCELSASISANNGTFLLYGSGTGSQQWLSKGTVAVDVGSSVTAAPITQVLTGVASISTDVTTLRINGTQAATSAADQGTGNYGNYPLFIGSRNNASQRFNGQMYSMTIVGKQVTATELSSTETYTAIKTGVTLA